MESSVMHSKPAIPWPASIDYLSSYKNILGTQMSLSKYLQVVDYTIAAMMYKEGSKKLCYFLRIWMNLYIGAVGVMVQLVNRTQLPPYMYVKWLYML